ncbi:hypothetical protein LWI29_012215 [Acer saccharum]|uniref:Uncharacterized protein n=1 Tax=Acer saccharum TaxID=4024 RepID=A0AA39RR34_ACESA|nr:hypothetical protein LWI29_012215 [Acer saccharum]
MTVVEEVQVKPKWPNHKTVATSLNSPSSLDRVSIVFFKTSTPSMDERFKDKSLFFIQLSSVGVDVR